jgi:hypothetical protein
LCKSLNRYQQASKMMVCLEVLQIIICKVNCWCLHPFRLKKRPEMY